MSYDGLGKAIMHYLESHRGRDHAVPRAKLEEDLGVFVPWKNVDRAFRACYCQLPLCTSERGLYLPVDTDDLIEFREYMKKKAIPHFERVRMVFAAHPAIAPDTAYQLELGI